MSRDADVAAAVVTLNRLREQVDTLERTNNQAWGKVRETNLERDQAVNELQALKVDIYRYDARASQLTGERDALLARVRELESRDGVTVAADEFDMLRKIEHVLRHNVSGTNTWRTLANCLDRLDEIRKPQHR